MHGEAGLCVCGVQVVLVQEARAPPAAKGPSSLHTFEPRKLLIYVYHTTPYSPTRYPEARSGEGFAFDGSSFEARGTVS